MDLQYQDILLKVFDQLSGMEKFRLDIAGVEIFENYSKVLFLKVGNTEGIKRILEHLKILWSRDLHRNYGSLSVSDPPHMTISKTDGRGMLYDSLGLFQKTGFSKQIEVTHLTPVSGFAGKTWDWGHHIKLS
jgi:2'-5' RNA ligase